MDLWDMFLNVLFISIPEEFFMVIIALYIMKRTDFLDSINWKDNLFKIMIKVVIPCAIFFNITLKLVGSTWNVPINTVFFTVCLCLLIKSDKIFKVAFFSFISIIILMTTQIITVFILVFILNQDFTTIGSSVATNFKIFMPERVFQFIVISLLFLKTNRKNKNSIIKSIYINKTLRSATIVLTLISIILFLVTMKSFAIDKSISNIDMSQQITIITCTLSAVILNMSIPWIIAYCIYSSETINNKGE